MTDGEESIDEARLCVEPRETRRVTFGSGNSSFTVDGAGVAYAGLGGSCMLSGLARGLRVGGGGGLGCPIDLDRNTLCDVGDRGYVGETPSDEISITDVFTGGGFRSGCIGGGAISVGRVGEVELGRGSSVVAMPRILPRSGERAKGEFLRFFDGDRDNRAFATDS